MGAYMNRHTGYYKITDINGDIIAEKVTTTEACQIIGVSRTHIIKSERAGNLIHKKYRLEKIEEEMRKISENGFGNYTKDQLDRWDRMVYKFRTRLDLDTSVLDAYNARKEGQNGKVKSK